MVGQVFPYETPVATWFANDPAFTYVVVPVRKDTGGWQNYPEAEAKKYVRMYFPRTYGDLIGYDFICYVDTFFGHLTGSQIDLMYRALRDEGLGGLTTLGGGISWVPEFRQSWESSSVSLAFPTDYLQPPEKIAYVYEFRVSVARSQDVPSVFKPYLALGVENQVGRQAAELGPRPGATVFASMRAAKGDGMPFAVEWSYGKASTWSIATDIQSDYNLWWTRWQGRDGYPYAMDLFLGMVLHSTGRQVPQDPVQFHNVRSLFGGYRERVSMLYSLVEFVEKFGANRQPIDRALAKVDLVEAEARDLYLSQDMSAAEETMKRAFSELGEVSVLAMKLKDQALMWVYLIEWASVTGTLLASGFVLWSIMVRRRLYRPSGTTRPS